MRRSTIESWLEGPGDLETAEVEDVPTPGESVLVRGLPARFSAEIQSHAKLSDDGRQQSITVDQATIERLTFAHGVVEPPCTEAQAKSIAEKYGPAFKRVVAKINELSGTSEEDAEKVEARFPDRRNGSDDSGRGELGADVEDPSQVGG